MRPRLCIFDFDGTLCATHDAIRYCVQQVFVSRGERLNVEVLEDVIKSGVGLADGLHRLRGQEQKPSDLTEWVDHYRQIYNSGEGLARTHLFPATAETLAALKSQGHASVVVSNKGEAAIYEALAHFEIRDAIAFVVGDRPGLPKKPDPSSYLTVIAPAFPQYAGQDTVVIGDTLTDLDYARNIGARSAWAQYGYGEQEACRAAQPDYILTSLSDLTDLLVD